MKYTFLGHQSWMIEEEDTKILLDPLLFDTFGSDPLAGIEVVPPRIINQSVYSDVDAILISHEHSDHFHIASLDRINRNVPIYVGVLTLSPLIEVLEKMGFTVIKVKSKTSIKIKKIDVRFYQAHPKTVLWESRVYQFLFTSLVNDFSLFIAVDALISKDFEAEIKNNIIASPGSVLISNNSQIPPSGVKGSLDNSDVAEQDNRNRTGPIAMKLIKSLIVDYSDLVHDLEHIVLCGGGFMKTHDTFGEFLMSNQGKVALLAKPIFPDKNIQGALPGMIFEDNKVSIEFSKDIVSNGKRLKELNDKFETFKTNPNWGLSSIYNSSEKDDENELIETTINCFKKKHRQIMSCDFGRLLVSVGSPSNCMEFIFLFDSEEKRYNFNWLENSWEPLSKNDETRPFGIRAFAKDFSEIVKGNIQIWDVAGLSVSTWYTKELKNSIKLSPMGFLYAVLGEHFNIDNFSSLCTQQLGRLNK